MAAGTVSHLSRALSTVAPFDAAAGWDPVGVQLGDPGESVGVTAVCHEVTSAVVDAALDRSVDTLVTYHPLLFHATRRLVAGPAASGRALRLARAGINLVVVHTAFDVAPGGTADALAEALELEAVTGFGPLWGPESVQFVAYAPPAMSRELREVLSALGAGPASRAGACSFRTAGLAARGDTEDEVERIEFELPEGEVDAAVAALGAVTGEARPRFAVMKDRGDAGFVGRVGELTTPLPVEAFAARVGSRLDVVPRVAAGGVALVERVAVLPGSGASMMAAAAATGASVFVTGDVAHHQARLANECGLAVVDAAHAPTERPGVSRLYAAVAEAVDVAVDLTTIDASPWEAR